MTHCASCGAPLHPGDAFCPNCGVTRSASICSSCGAKLKADARFCEICGQQVRTPGVAECCDRTIAPQAATESREATKQSSSVPPKKRPLRLILALAVVVVMVAAGGVALALVLEHKSAAPAQPDWRTIGYSVQHRPIVAATFGNSGNRTLVIGGFHGAEYGAAVANKFAAYLARNPAALPHGVEVDVIRCLNPDGQFLGTRGNAHHTDLNRNFPTTNWSSELRKGDPSRTLKLNGGTYPGSEPETKALLAYLQRGYSLIISLHSNGGYVDYNGPDGHSLAAIVARSVELPVQITKYQASIGGSLGEYVPQHYGLPIVTVELNQPRLTMGLINGLLKAAKTASLDR